MVLSLTSPPTGSSRSATRAEASCVVLIVFGRGSDGEANASLIRVNLKIPNYKVQTNDSTASPHTKKKQFFLSPNYMMTYMI